LIAIPNEVFEKKSRLLCGKMGCDLIPYHPRHHPLARRAKLFRVGDPAPN